MIRAWLIPVLAAVCVTAGRAEEAFPSEGRPATDTPAVAFEDRAAFAQVGEKLRVAAYNIENFTDAVGDGDDRTPELMQAQARGAAANLDEIDADLALIIEIENAAALQALNKTLARPYPAGYITHLGEGAPDEQKLNIAVLTRVPLVDLREIDFGPLTGAGRPTRGVLRVQADLGGGRRLAVYAVHLKSNYGYRPRNMYKRRHALQLVMEDVKSLRASDPAITWEMLVVGDMNVDPELPEFSGDWSLSPLRGWKDLWRGRPIHERMTIPTRYGDPALEFPPACFDRIYAGADLTNAPWRVGSPGVVQKGVQTRNVKALPGQEGHVSDHYPVFVDLLRE